MIRLPEIIIIAVCLLAAFAPPAQAKDYAVGEDDVIRILVYGHPDLSVTERVSGEGFITFPLIGSVRVSGLTVDQIAKAISEKLSEGFIVDPQISVFVTEYKSRKAIIMGQVQKPGIYMLSGPTTFLELLSMAGGISQDAGDKAIIKRKRGDGDRGETTFTIDLRLLLEEGKTFLDITLSDSDSIYIPKASVFYITGEIRKPDAYKLQDGMTVIKAIVKAGGFTEKASKSRIRIIRRVDNQEKVLERVEMDEAIMPDDIVIIPESFF